ncbi:hypothetical protein ANCDUO_05564 [Ancylostoma duodenale]|uniref:Uncharacterized protein n=1 Tax=Ancylostoma duodenale TaxID=51022 RepID=A0A0C2GYD1_9BILA|nr:hypothetical protein ANCDUO_05564 [Ancylostoma duodenale]
MDAINVKRQYLTTTPELFGTITVDGIDLPQINASIYLSSAVSSDGSLTHNVIAPYQRLVEEVEITYWCTVRQAHSRSPKAEDLYSCCPFSRSIRHVLRACGDKVWRISFDLDVSDKRSNRREKQRRIDMIDDDLKLAGIHRYRAQYRAKWRRRITDADAVTKREKH